jgi:structural maintenance of chromosome 4
MEVLNFKSYAGKKTVGPFHKNFSAVVGPNGSGKSNVIDALLFVFGKRASKLRLKKVSELIHKSSAFPNCQETRVDVFFADIIDKGEDDYDIVPNSQIVVSRYANKNNSSKYYVNNKEKTWSQVGTLLRERGIDLDNNRFLILQGEVELISQMPAKAGKPGEDGLLEYLEDIIGSNKFVEPIAKAGTDFELAEEQRSQLKNRVKASERQRDGLEGAKNEVEAFLKLENDVRTQQWILYNKYCYNFKKEAERCSSLIDQLKETTEGENKKMEELTESCSKMEKELSITIKEDEVLQIELKNAKKEYAAFERKDIKFREDLKHQKNALKKILVSIQRAGKTVNDNVAKIEQLKNEKPILIKKLEKAGEAHEKAMAQMEIVQSEVKAETGKLRAQLEQKRIEMKPVVENANGLKAEYDESAAEIKLVKDRVRTARQRNVEANAALRKAITTKEGHADTIKRLTEEKTKAADRLEDAEMEKGEAEEEEKKAQTAARKARVKMEEYRAQMHSANSKQGLAKALSDAQQAGGALSNSGLLGRLGDLGAIDKKYDVAISTACGALDYLVSRTAKGATKCVDFLRKNKLGRSTFIVLEKLNYLKKSYEKECRTPEQVPRLFDLVKFNDESLRPAFYYALRNTLVANDLEQAIRIAYQGNKCVWRVVTLNGEMIEQSGAMSGGGKNVRRGRMGSSVQQSTTNEPRITEKDIEAVAMELDTAEKIRNEARDARRGLEREIRELNGILKKLNVRIPKMEIELQSADTQIPELKTTIEELSKQLELSEEETDRLTTLEQSNKEQDRKYKLAKAKADVFVTAVGALEKKIMNAGGARLQKAKSAVVKAQNAANEIQTSYSKLSQQIKQAKKIALAASQKEEAEQLEAEKLERKYEKTKAQFKQIEEDALQVLEKFEEVGKLKEEKEKELKALNKSYSKSASELKKLRDSLQSFLNEMEDLDRQFNEANTTANAWDAKLNELKGGDEEEEATTSETHGDDAKAKEMSGGNNNQEDDINNTFKKNTLITPTDEYLDQIVEKNLENEIKSLQASVEKLRANVDMNAIEEYRKLERACLERVNEFQVATQARDEIRDVYEKLRKQRLSTFMSGFQIITMKLKEMYQMITLGGDAELELVDTLDPFSEGIVFSVRPKGKSWKNIANLSGGEKTLSSLALVFALHHFKPTPLYVMDEIDAALDFRNVSIVANYIKERTKNAQFIIISLRNNMFDLANRLVGIYKTHDVTKSVAVNPKKIMKDAMVFKLKQMQKRRQEGPPLGEVTNNA